MLNNNLKFAREEIGITQEELGKVFGVTKGTVSNWENNNDIIPLKNLIKFCDIYNYSLDFIAGLSRKNKGHLNIGIIDKQQIGNNLKKFRIKHNMSQQQLADECSISREAYCHYELGINLVSTLALYTICKNYNINMEDMISKKNN